MIHYGCRQVVTHVCGGVKAVMAPHLNTREVIPAYLLLLLFEFLFWQKFFIKMPEPSPKRNRLEERESESGP